MPKLSEPEKRDAPTLAKLVFDLLRRQRSLHNRSCCTLLSSALFTARHDVRVREYNAVGINVSRENGGIWSQGWILVY